MAKHLREIVGAPTVKGEASRRLTEVLDQPYLRFCRPCGATHAYEMTFRLASLQAGLELGAGASPPVLRRIPGLRPGLYRRLGGEADPRFDVVRNYLRFYGPARARDAATFLDAPVKEVKAHWPADAELLVPEEAHRKDLWRVLGRPGAIVTGGEIAGTWRPATSGRKLKVRIEAWRSLDRQERAGVEEQAASLAAHRGAVTAEVVEA